MSAPTLKDKLRGKALAVGYNLSCLSSELGIAPSTLTRKMSGESDFTRQEISQIRRLLSLSAAEIDDIFFTH